MNQYSFYTNQGKKKMSTYHSSMMYDDNYHLVHEYFFDPKLVGIIDDTKKVEEYMKNIDLNKISQPKPNNLKTGLMLTAHPTIERLVGLTLLANPFSFDKIITNGQFETKIVYDNHVVIIDYHEIKIYTSLNYYFNKESVKVDIDRSGTMFDASKLFDMFDTFFRNHYVSIYEENKGQDSLQRNIEDLEKKVRAICRYLGPLNCEKGKIIPRFYPSISIEIVRKNIVKLHLENETIPFTTATSVAKYVLDNIDKHYKDDVLIIKDDYKIVGSFKNNTINIKLPLLIDISDLFDSIEDVLHSQASKSKSHTFFVEE